MSWRFPPLETYLAILIPGKGKCIQTAFFNLYVQVESVASLMSCSYKIPHRYAGWKGKEKGMPLNLPLIMPLNNT